MVESFEKGTGDNEGKLRFTFKYPDLFPTLKFALDSKTRQKILIADENKVSCNRGKFPKFLLTFPVQRKRPSLQGSYHPPR